MKVEELKEKLLSKTMDKSIVKKIGETEVK